MDPVTAAAITEISDVMTRKLASRILMPFGYASTATDVIKIVGTISNTVVHNWNKMLNDIDTGIEGATSSYACVKDILDEALWGKLFIKNLLNAKSKRFVVEQYIYYSLRKNNIPAKNIDMKGTLRKVSILKDGLFSAPYYESQYSVR